jgi:endonuclease/exonuclease/phosphatase family metal-dependent hydrolase
VCALAVFLTAAGAARQSSAQTTITLPAVTWGTVRGGSYANTFQGDLISTRASDSAEFVRRAMLKFDTQNRIPAGAHVTSATLSVFIQYANDGTPRHVGAYQISESFGDNDFTWTYRRRSQNQRWQTVGGDLGTRLAVASVGSKAGSRISFDVTPLVAQAVAGDLGSSRYTRVALVDMDGSSRDSYREYATPNATTASARPVLTVTYSGAKSGGSGSSGGSSSPAPSGDLVVHGPSQVVYATLRGGSYADTNIDNILETRASSNGSYLRRALLKFDTENTIAAGTSIKKAVVTVAVKDSSADPTRRIAAYQVTESWSEHETTWNLRRSGERWSEPGGALGAKLAEATVSSATGSRATFDITALVQKAVSGSLGSRYTRIALVDEDTPLTNDSYRAYYRPGDGADLEPALAVTFGSGSPKPPSDPPPSDPPSQPAPPPATNTGATLKVLEYNVHHGGIGTDGKYDPQRIVDWIAKMDPDIVSLCEMQSRDSYNSGDGVAQYKAMLEQKTGVKWYSWDMQDYGDWSNGGIRNAILSRLPFISTYRHEFSVGKDRTIGGVTISVNGRNINFMSTHFDPDNASYRTKQGKETVSYAEGFAEERIILGDFNDQPSHPAITAITGTYYDAWAEGAKTKIAKSPKDNPNGYTRNSRIDYVFYSRKAGHLTLKRVEVIDTRDSKGHMPSDHRPLMATFDVK